MAAKTILIKKYENRRLYDATNSRYVNLEEVAQMVQQGNDVHVVDAATGEDLTRLILTQIIAEGAKAPQSNFPLDILRQMIIASGRATQDSALQYTKAMLDLYQSTYKAMAPALNPFEFLQNQPAAGSADAKATASPRASAVTPGTNADAAAREIEELRARLAEIERAVSVMSSPKDRSAARNRTRKGTARKASARKSSSKK